MQNWKENNIWHGLSLNTIYNMDCIEGMKLIPDWSIDCIITDPPYWTTACKRDTVIPFEPMWEQLKRIIKPNGAIVLFWSEPFSSALRMSNIKNYKYDWIWEKNKWANFASIKYQPMKVHEIISVFNKHNYYPQKEEYSEAWKSRNKYKRNVWWKIAEVYWITKIDMDIIPEGNLRNPRSVFKINTEHWLHPTQKPVALIEYLIKTYTLEWETVLDFTMGSGTTAIACINTNRNYIGFELDKWYRNIANKRIQDRLSEK